VNPTGQRVCSLIKPEPDRARAVQSTALAGGAGLRNLREKNPPPSLVFLSFFSVAASVIEYDWSRLEQAKFRCNRGRYFHACPLGTICLSGGRVRRCHVTQHGKKCADTCVG
jgi:hypothetical protein